ncbi:formylglycine-generating enzyme family protein [Prosthecobacter dejongeii]|uniref:Formylglycine-generating enzyme required for sulfatase activity n=1 Tax=Prosthecobacter dejongeii TaxID=48465 RepID=A0A7W7YJR4_9BACT|nr:SUMF1/EgtB/PvdO family nonheme iron enzyme [Prosthecobacter dejongeii]MBB5037501.1 formylglycine-generating enzyme required for sulfatase activity [Prosthecobacter dejongeii]
MLSRRILTQSLACWLFSQAYTSTQALIEETPRLEAGVYEGIVSRNSFLDGGLGLGGKLDLLVTSTGSLTGKLLFDGTTLRFSGDQEPSEADPTALRFTLGKGKRGPVLTLEITQDSFSGEPYFRLITGDETSATIQVQKRVTNLAEVGERLEGAYTWSLNPGFRKPKGATVLEEGEGRLPVPEGYGFMTARVLKTGLLRWSGKLADGTAVTGSGYLTESSSRRFVEGFSSYAAAWHQVLYRGKGSVQGWFDLYDERFDEGRSKGDVFVEGYLDWKKLKVSDAFYIRNYRDGFPLHELDVRGGKYERPAAGELVMDLANGPNNAQLTVEGAGMPSPVINLLTVTAQNKAIFSLMNEGYPVTKLNFQPTTGTFSGTLLFKDISPRLPTNSIERSVRFQGVLLSRSSTGAGFFMLGQLPTDGPPPTTMRYSPELSGRVEIREAFFPESQGFVHIPGGEFQMGNAYNEGNTHERPVHPVYVSPFYIQAKETTKSQWDVVYKWALKHGYTFDNAGVGRAANHPVVYVNWYDAVKWCNARSEMEGLTPCYRVRNNSGPDTVYRTGQVSDTLSYVVWLANGYRLPTEAEWEKAARGGPEGRRFPFGDFIDFSLANYYAFPGNGTFDLAEKEGFHPVFGYNVAYRAPYLGTSPVGSFFANGYGLYDVIGNASEHCWDVFKSNAYSAQGPFNDPRGPDSSWDKNPRVLRGGNFSSNDRVSSRGQADQDFTYNYIGFRTVRYLQGEDN